mmetsp:Transcript_8761/g.27558  ORF Transcript_8761/g.27558 Transcript_8761/m.27558 type:complete len:841 (-) Transcript_8761:1009-3531(-)
MGGLRPPCPFMQVHFKTIPSYLRVRSVTQLWTRRGCVSSVPELRDKELARSFLVDDMRLRIYNYNTMEKVKEIEAHADYIRYIEIHPSQALVLSSSDDMSIKLWNWEQNWECTFSFEGHSHYVMMTRFNCKDTNTFASASLDRSIKVWGIGAHQPHFSLEGHERGVNCIDYYSGGDKPYLLSGADDKTIKIWDYQTKACIQTLEGHSNNVCSVLFHPRLPVLVSASEDGTVRVWHATTYRAETTLNYGLERAWSIAVAKESNGLAIGYDEGTVLIKLGQDAPVASLDTHTGKLVWANNNDVLSASLKGTFRGIQDGEHVPLAARDMGSCEVYPQTVQHNCNGRFLVVCGDGEYIIYTSQALRNKSYGHALDFAWSAVGTGDYAVRESLSRVKIFKNFKEYKTIKCPIPASEEIFGGSCLAVRGSDCVCFFEWSEGTFLCKIDVLPISVHWNDTQELVILTCSDQAHVLKFDREAVDSALAGGSASLEQGVPTAFEPVHEVSDNIVAGQWVGDCFIYTNAAGRLNYLVGGNSMTICHLDSGPLFMLGYLAKENRIILMDRSRNVVSYGVLLAVLQYQTAVVRKDFDAANALLPAIPETELSSVARFLESQGYKEVALQVSRDSDHKFELALELQQIDTARELLDELQTNNFESTEQHTKWKRLGDLALAACDLRLAVRCAKNAMDMPGLLMLYSAAGDREGMKWLAEASIIQGQMNVAFVAYFILGHVEDCLELLLKLGRVPEAALLARTYLPSQISRTVEVWRQDLQQVSDRAASALADPQTYPNLFPDLEWAFKVEEIFMTNRNKHLPASSYERVLSECWYVNGSPSYCCATGEARSRS